MDRKKFLINGVSLLGLVTVAPHVLGSKPTQEDDEKSNCWNDRNQPSVFKEPTRRQSLQGFCCCNHD